MPKILILMSDTGGGHRASAQALEAAFCERYGDRFQIDIIDLWTDHTPWPINQIPKLYSPIINRGVWFWKFLWRVSERAWLTTAFLRLVGLFVQGTMQQAFAKYNPDLVISVHPLMQEIPLRVLRRMGKSTPFFTVVTDLATINPLWFHKAVVCCFVASEEARQRGLRAGLRPDQITVLGLPVRPAFARPIQARDELRRQLKLDRDRLTALLVSGGEGMGPVASIARAVTRRLAGDDRHAQLVVICGRNERLRQELLQQAWPIPTRIEGFVKNMPEWMAASDCIITKAGPGTIAEALISGLPILLSGYIPGQEEGNVPYVVENGVGAYNEDPAEIAAIVSRWFGPEREKLHEMAQKAREMSHPQASFDIIERITELTDA